MESDYDSDDSIEDKEFLLKYDKIKIYSSDSEDFEDSLQESD
jgi:hypothetical protein